MKRLLFVVATLAVAVVFAETAAPAKDAAPAAAKEKAVKKTPLTPAQQEARRRAREMKRFGGYIIKPNSSAGKILFVDTRKAAKDTAAADVVAFLRKTYQYPAEVVQGDADQADVSKVGKTAATMTIVLCEKPDSPALLISPEDMWASVNATRLARGCADPKVFAARVRKELTRAFCFLAGAGNSMGSATVMTPIFSNMELDERFVEEIPPDVDGKFNKHLAAFGIKPWIRSTYTYACEEGWAPQPTNEFPKAIWDKVHAAPTKPIVIAPETTKQK